MPPAADLVGLIPETYDDFRSVGFWDGFFEKRQDNAFEWYGEWPNMRSVAGPLCGPGRTVLVVGCGNSDLSAQMYDDGIPCITNLDFSKVVIRQMMAKHLRVRPLMKWNLGDMTAMKYADGSFDVVMDKGGLDALMGEDNLGAGQAADKFLREVVRVLRPDGGVYVCVTLAQPHVLDALLSVFQGAGWDAVLHKLKPPADMSSAPLQPYLVALTSRRGGSSGGQRDALPSDVRLAFRAEVPPWAPDRDHMALVLQTITRHNLERAAERSGDQLPPPPAFFDTLRPGRRTVLQLPPRPATAPSPAALSPAASAPPAAPPACAPAAQAPYQGRFTAAVCDVEGAASGALECAVFLVPQGRELEWLFSCEEGQLQVASGCNARRVILVAINRAAAIVVPVGGAAALGPTAAGGLWREFVDLGDVQRALSPLMVPLLPLAVRDVPKAVPFMTLGGGIGRRVVRETAHSAMSGDVVVEDVELHGDEDEEADEEAASSGRGGVASPSAPARGRWVRRLVFLSNRGRIQSEVPLRPTPAGGTAATGAGGTLDHSRLSCGYHGGLVAGLCLVQPHLQAINTAGKGSSDGGPRCLLIGLGGGTLAVFLQRYFGMQVLAVELDEVVVGLARRHFGVDDGPGTRLEVEVADGTAVAARLAGPSREELLDGYVPPPSLARGEVDTELLKLLLSSGSSPMASAVLNAAIAAAAARVACASEDAPAASSEPRGGGAAPPPLTAVSPARGASHPSGPAPAASPASFDFLIVDADCGDPSLPMSCPPPVFLEPAFLAAAVRLVGSRGLLAVNCVSRAQGAVQGAVRALQACFAHVYELDVDEDVNRLLFATQHPATHVFRDADRTGAPPAEAAAVAAALVAVAAQPLSTTVAAGLEDSVRCLRLMARAARS